MNREDIIKALDWHPAFCERHEGSLLDRIEKIVRKAEAAEREACAKVCDSHALAESVPGAPTWSEACAAAIRARGQE